MDSTDVPGQVWDTATITTLEKNIDHMQKSDKFNKYGLKLPRNKDESPQLWGGLGSSSWDQLRKEFSVRLRRWRTACNRAHETNESAATLFLLYVVWWFRTGGKCHVLGFRLTPWVLHDANYSFGRGTFYLDEAGNPTSVAILAGTQMKSGCTTTLPTDMEADFDFTQMTVVAES